MELEVVNYNWRVVVCTDYTYDIKDGDGKTIASGLTEEYATVIVKSIELYVNLLVLDVLNLERLKRE